MKAKLIKNPMNEYHLIVDKVPQFAYITEPVTGGYVIASSVESELFKLSIKNCEAIANGYDLDDCVDYFKKGKLYIQQDGVIILAGENGNDGIIIQDPLKTRGVGHYSDEWNPRAFCEFKQKALELMGDKKFSEEDMISFSEFVSKKYINQHKFLRDKTLKGFFTTQEIFNEYQSLQQTEWEVEIEMEKVIDETKIVGVVKGVKGSGNKITTYKSVPKLDADRCLILKRSNGSNIEI